MGSGRRPAVAVAVVAGGSGSGGGVVIKNLKDDEERL